MKKIYPFKFLDSYTLEDSSYFFGRTEEIDILYNMVFQTDLLVVYGASGTGKTSLIQCGLASRFQSHEWLSIFIRRGNNLNQSLEKAIIENGGDAAIQDDELDWLESDWAGGESAKPDGASALSKRFKAIYLRHFKPLYLIFDQFEELFILGSKEEQDTFIGAVKEILLLKQPIKIIISIREEYLGYLYDFERQLPQLLRKRLRVEPMTLEKVTDVIQGVATLPESLIRLLKDDENIFAEKVFQKIKGEEKKISIDLPYLQVFLDKLYLEITHDETRSNEALFQVCELEKTGEMGDVLRDFLDEQVMLIGKSLNIKTEVIWRILSPFITLEGTKEPLSLEEVINRLPGLENEVISAVIHAIENKRILRFSEKDGLYEIAHDSLARQIHARRSDEEIALLEVRRLIKSHCALTQEARELFSARQLAFIDPYLVNLPLTSAEQELIDQSREKIEQERLEEHMKALKEKRRQRKIRMVIISAAMVSLAFGIFGFTNMVKARKSEQELRNGQFAKNMDAAYQYQQKSQYVQAIESYNHAIDFIDSPAAKDSIKKCTILLGYMEQFQTQMRKGDSLFTVKEYVRALQAYSLAQQTGYQNIRELIEDRKQEALQVLTKDLQDYRKYNLDKLAKKAMNDLESIHLITKPIK